MQVSMMEDDQGRVHLRNLSMHRANSEEDALNLLFLGDTNRTISETPMNMASSRSHCVFTVYVESRKEGSDKVSVKCQSGGLLVGLTGVGCGCGCWLLVRHSKDAS
jgi:hypothetical protein